ncbi:MAG: flagellar basal body-associated FliL family protein, partial [Desulfuromonadaceae bacterium]|nr:flagellar basal body-associated FliL family protein [Desulfuromonadaceae bacterium]
IEPFIINILDKDGTRYLKAAITLETNNDPVVEEITQRMPQIRDSILLLVGNKTFGELADLQGKLQLRSELRERLNKILTGGRVEKIYFTEFVVQ